MSCPCQIDGNDGSGTNSQMRDIKYPIAHKEHCCFECNRTIKKGEKYERVRGLWEGEFGTWGTCIDCQSARDNLFCSWINGEVWEAIGESIPPLPPAECMMALTKPARDKVCDLVEKQWEDTDD